MPIFPSSYIEPWIEKKKVLSAVEILPEGLGTVTRATGAYLLAHFGLPTLLQAPIPREGSEYSIPPDARDSFDQTPLVKAAAQRQDAIAKSLVTWNDNVLNEKDDEGRTVLSHAVSPDHTGCEIRSTKRNSLR